MLEWDVEECKQVGSNQISNAIRYEHDTLPNTQANYSGFFQLQLTNLISILVAESLWLATMEEMIPEATLSPWTLL